MRKCFLVICNGKIPYGTPKSMVILAEDEAAAEDQARFHANPIGVTPAFAIIPIEMSGTKSQTVLIQI